MVSAELSVVTYLPQGNSMAHWAIYLRVVNSGHTQHLIYQANGDVGALVLDVREANPKTSSRFRSQVHVAELDSESTITEVKQILEGQAMRNDIPSWNCQDWVMEALEAASDADLLDEYTYSDAKDTLNDLYHD